MSTPSPSDDPVPAQVRAVIDLFATQLAKVAFPEVDAASLSREAEELRAEAVNVARARAALEAAEAARARREAALAAVAARAVAYARIYCDAHPERAPLATALANLDVATAAAAAIATESRPAGKRRGRPPRRSAELFDAAALPPGPPHEPPA
jgi:hypothetical protein